MDDKDIVRKFKRNKIKTALICIALVAAALVGGKAALWIDDLITPEPDTVETSQIREEIEPVLMAVSYKYNFTEILHHSDAKGIDVPVVKDLLENNYVATIEGTAFIGIDMDANKDVVDFEVGSNAQGELTEVKVTLPKSEVFALQIDESSLVVYEDRGGVIPFVNDITKEDTQELRKKAQEQQTQQVIDNGLLELSDERIREIVTAQIKSAHGDAVEVNVEFVDREKNAK